MQFQVESGFVRPLLAAVALAAVAAGGGCAHGSNGGTSDGAAGSQTLSPRQRAIRALPASSKALARIHPRKLAALQNHPLMANVLRTGVCTLLARVGRHLEIDTSRCGMTINAAIGALTGRSLEHLSRDRSIWLAVATTGRDELLRRALWGIPSETEDDGSTVRLHLRALVPATDAGALHEELEQLCAEPNGPCPPSPRVEPVEGGEFVALDAAIPNREGAVQGLAAAVREGPDGPPALLERETAARRSLTDGESAVALYSRFRALADLAALEALARRSKGSDRGDGWQRFERIHRASTVYGLFRPRSTEFEDVAVALGGDASGAWSELLLTPTAHGASLAKAAPASQSAPVVTDVSEPHFRAVWNVDTPRLLNATKVPEWDSPRQIGFVLRQSTLGQLQFTAYPFAQGKYLWETYRRRLQNQPLFQIADRLFETRYLDVAGRLVEGGARPKWSVAAAASFPTGTWSETDAKQLRSTARAFVGPESALSLEEKKGLQAMKFTAHRKPEASFSSESDSSDESPLRVDLEAVEDVRVERPLARMVLGAAPLRLRGRFDAEAAIVRFTAGADVSPEPSDPKSEAAPWKSQSRWSECLLPVYRARHRLYRRARATSDAERASTWKKQAAKVVTTLEACPSAGENETSTARALEAWRALQKSPP